MITKRITSVLMLLGIIFVAAGYLLETDFTDIKAIAAEPAANSTISATSTAAIASMRIKI